MTEEDPTLSRPVLEVVAIASEYCTLIENADTTSLQALTKALSGFAPLLYLRGSLLVSNEPEYPEANERYVTEEQWENSFNRLRTIFGEQDEFWVIDYNETNHNDPIKASIAECLTDVYQDLKDFVILFKQNSLAARENAVYSCHILFRERWGFRLAQLLPVIHTLLTDTGDATNRQESYSDFF